MTAIAATVPIFASQQTADPQEQVLDLLRKPAEYTAVPATTFDRRRPQFKQVIQDLEHQGATERRSDAEREIRDAIAASGLGVNPQTVVADLFSTVEAPLTGYRRMMWTVAAGDDGHWDPDPKQAREVFVARAFQKANPDAQLRVLVFDVPMSHYGHIERPRQLAGGLLAAVEWLYVIARPDQVISL